MLINSKGLLALSCHTRARTNADLLQLTLKQPACPQWDLYALASNKIDEHTRSVHGRIFGRQRPGNILTMRL